MQTLDRLQYKDMTPEQINVLILKVLKYFNDLHLDNFFHGNIKTDKIWI